jgi:hypothetical protein
MKAKIERYLKCTMYWFDLFMFFVGYLALSLEFADRNLMLGVLVLACLFLIYLVGKSWFYPEYLRSPKG